MQNVDHSSSSQTSAHSSLELGERLFRWRDYTPIPIVLITLFVADPSIFTATLGTLVIVLGELIRIYSVAFIGSISRTRKDNLGSNLISNGPYAWVRNPIYVGNFFIVFGFAIFAGVFWLLVAATALFAFQYYFIVKYEENLLLEKFGAEFADFCKTTPAWIPKKKIRLQEIDWPSDFSKALKSEKRTLTGIAALLLLLAIF